MSIMKPLPITPPIRSAAEKRGLVLDDSSPSELKTKSDQMSEKEHQLKHQLASADADHATGLKVDPCMNGGQPGEHRVAVAATALCSGAPVGHIKHISGGLNVDDLYALPNKRNKNNNATAAAAATIHDDAVPECTSSDEGGDEKGNHEDVEDKDANKDLPPGWEKHEGECGSI